MANNMKPVLWITGDSFSEIKNDDVNHNTWPIALAKTLGYDLYNESLAGTAQDWAFLIIKKYKSQITPNDQIIVALTHPSRFWFFEDLPDVSNSSIVNFEEIVNDNDRVAAARYYIRYLQRLNLDCQMLDHRLGWLNNLVLINNWKPPLIILGFNQLIDEQEYPNLMFSRGSLFDVSKQEEGAGVENRGWDPRYNHMCISNHAILVEKIVNTLNTGTVLNLTTGFLQNIFNSDLLADSEHAAQELSIERLNLYNSSGHSPGSWYSRIWSN